MRTEETTERKILDNEIKDEKDLKVTVRDLMIQRSQK